MKDVQRLFYDFIFLILLPPFLTTNTLHIINEEKPVLWKRKIMLYIKILKHKLAHVYAAKLNYLSRIKKYKFIEEKHLKKTSSFLCNPP
jgi:hypothetical protein